MKTNAIRIGALLLAVGIFAWGAEARAQVTTTETVTTNNGAFTEFVPGSETVVINSETDHAPLRYVVTKQTTIVDETGARSRSRKFRPAARYQFNHQRWRPSRGLAHRGAPPGRDYGTRKPPPPRLAP